jgi:hypothetical protein
MEKLKGFAFWVYRGYGGPDHEGGEEDSKCPVENVDVFLFHIYDFKHQDTRTKKALKSKNQINQKIQISKPPKKNYLQIPENDSNYKPQTTNHKLPNSQALTSSSITNFFIFNNACIAFWPLTGFIMSAPRLAGMICQETPKGSLSQPHMLSCPPLAVR